MENTVLTIVHTLKPSSLTHSLQIHCTGLTGLRSHASWAWTEKRDPRTLFGCFLREDEEEEFGGVLTTSNFSFFILLNWRDLEGEWSIQMLDQMKYKIYPYHINKITNKKTNYSPPPYLILKTSKQGGG